MQVDVSFKLLERSEFIDNLLDKNLERLERRVRIFRRDDPIHLSIHLEKNPHREQYFCRAHLHLPSKILQVNEGEESLNLVINKAFGALTRQLDKLKYKVERYLRKKGNPPKEYF